MHTFVLYRTGLMDLCSLTNSRYVDSGTQLPYFLHFMNGCVCVLICWIYGYNCVCV